MESRDLGAILPPEVRGRKRTSEKVGKRSLMIYQLTISQLDVVFWLGLVEKQVGSSD